MGQTTTSTTTTKDGPVITDADAAAIVGGYLADLVPAVRDRDDDAFDRVCQAVERDGYDFEEMLYVLVEEGLHGLTGESGAEARAKLMRLIAAPKKAPLSMRQVLPYRTELRRTDHRDAVEPGLDAVTGEPIQLNLREHHMLIVGGRRSGASNFLHAVIGDLAQHDDELIWVIDPEGGWTAMPFLYAYGEKRTEKPTVDWVAPDLDEALIMARTALAIVEHRRFRLHRERAGYVDGLLPLSSTLPGITIVVDGLESLNEDWNDGRGRELTELLQRIQRLGGATNGVRIIARALRATHDRIPPGFRKGFGVVVGLHCSDREELAYLFGGYDCDPALTPELGSGYIRLDPHGMKHRFKAYYVDPATADRIAVGTATWRPDLDDRSKEIAGQLYAERWTRVTHLFE